MPEKKLPTTEPGSAAEDVASGPAGATDKVAERATKFDEEGGDQPQAPSQAAVERELQQVQGQQGASQEPKRSR